MKTKSMILRTLAVIAAASICLLASCNKSESSSDTVPNGESNTQQTGESYNDTKDTGDITDNKQINVKTVLDLKWNHGYIASYMHVSNPDKEVAKGDYYSYTDVFTVEKAGTTITFVDDNNKYDEDSSIASFKVYVVSSWKKLGNNWVLDLDNVNYAGSNDIPSDILVSYENGVATYSYTTSIDNENIRLCYASGETANFKPDAYPEVVAEQSGNEGTAAYRLKMDRWLVESMIDFYSPSLRGVTVNALGDSYFAGHVLLPDQICLNLMAEKYDMNMNNYGVGGSTVSTKGGNPMCNRYANMANNDPDIVIVEGGRYDFSKNTPIGAVNSKDKATYSGALNVIIDGLQVKYPNAMIVCISPWNFPDVAGKPTCFDYANAMQAVAAQQGVYFIRACDPEISGIDARDEEFREKYFNIPSDVSHLNFEGMKIAMTHFEKVLAEFYEQFLASKATN